MHKNHQRMIWTLTSQIIQQPVNWFAAGPQASQWVRMDKISEGQVEVTSVGSASVQPGAFTCYLDAGLVRTTASNKVWGLCKELWMETCPSLPVLSKSLLMILKSRSLVQRWRRWDAYKKQSSWYLKTSMTPDMMEQTVRKLIVLYERIQSRKRSP
jgi:hypothetical protein